MWRCVLAALRNTPRLRCAPLLVTFASTPIQIQIGASAVYVEDLREEFLKSYILPSIQCNAIYENLYLMGTSLGAWKGGGGVRGAGWVEARVAMSSHSLYHSFSPPTPCQRAPALPSAPWRSRTRRAAASWRTARRARATTRCALS